MEQLRMTSAVCERGAVKINLKAESGEQFQLALLTDEMISFLSLINNSLAEIVGRPKKKDDRRLDGCFTEKN